MRRYKPYFINPYLDKSLLDKKRKKRREEKNDMSSQLMSAFEYLDNEKRRRDMIHQWAKTIAKESDSKIAFAFEEAVSTIQKALRLGERFAQIPRLSNLYSSNRNLENKLLIKIREHAQSQGWSDVHFRINDNENTINVELII